MTQTGQPNYLIWQGSKFLKNITKKHKEHIQLPKYPVWDNEKLYFRNPAFVVYLCPHTSFLKPQCRVKDHTMYWHSKWHALYTGSPLHFYFQIIEIHSTISETSHIDTTIRHDILCCTTQNIRYINNKFTVKVLISTLSLSSATRYILHPTEEINMKPGNQSVQISLESLGAIIWILY